MSKNIERFSPEFRQECVDLVLLEKHGVKEAAQAMGIGKSTLSKWIRISNLRTNGKTVSGVSISPEQAKIRELEKRIKRIEMENSILKKATALLASDSIRNLN